ncbi:hypothetical protein NDU88_003013 [Pleurodeles waltl]|uniref:Uncharacterized protein n=1 Tax=Pleurodeles waltl TaxID=8319 RepID=A0AAV7T3J6_PLEWA|nr:hypothetical protein NDU88_003013 [Pleurodeles waltl]
MEYAERLYRGLPAAVASLKSSTLPRNCLVARCGSTVEIRSGGVNNSRWFVLLPRGRGAATVACGGASTQLKRGIVAKILRHRVKIGGLEYTEGWGKCGRNTKL